MERLQKQIEFIVEIDKLKSIFRRTYLCDKSRLENDTEHSWHLAMMALLLSEYANDDVDILHVAKMVLVHDIVEIDAGDVFIYDYEARKAQEEKEEKAAQRLFSLLPEDQRDEIYSLWREYEDQQTPESHFAKSLDRLQPLLLNIQNEGGSWRKAGIKADNVLKINSVIEKGSKTLWKYAESRIKYAVQKGYLEE